MEYPLPTETAERHCTVLQESLDRYGSLELQEDGAFTTEALFSASGGQMFGVLVCEDEQGQEHILKAFSGQYEGRFLVPGWVPPVCDPVRFDEITERYDVLIRELSARLEASAAGEQRRQLKEERKRISGACLREIHALYRFRCLDGSVRTLADIFPSCLPPTGTGDCCAPKLLQHAFSLGLHPVSMAEFYYGRTNRSGTREHKSFYPPCEQRCRPLLREMLGLDIVYRSKDILVINKPSGLLSVPGRGPEKYDSAASRVRELFPASIEHPAVHRLDMDTSGLMILALTKEAHRAVSIQFIKGRVQKQYVALIDGVIRGSSGYIELPFRLDVENRPYQIYDLEHGKLGRTNWEKLQVEYLPPRRPVTRVLFTPHTGRTHQLRVHSAHEKGLGLPIVGDRLYGTQAEGERLMLHAFSIRFSDPDTGEMIELREEAPF